MLQEAHDELVKAREQAPEDREILLDLADVELSLGAVGEAIHDFEVILPPGGHGILEFIAEGRDARGKGARGAIGIAAGESPSTGVPRLGAMEFPATVLPAEER